MKIKIYMKKLVLLCMLGCMSLFVFAQPNWSENIAPILYSKCTTCHNSYGIAPFSLITYQDAFVNSATIRQQVNGRKMPPWPPDPNYRHLAHERTLTADEITAIDDWVTNGSPKGDSTLAPLVPVYSSQAEITSPDLVSRIPNYLVNTTTDLYRCFVIPTGFATQKFLTEIEAIPGNRSIVHHILIYEDTSNVPSQLDAADPGPGYTEFGGTGSTSSNLIGVWVPGQGTYRLPAGMGIKLPAQTNIILQIHYPGGTSSQIDSTKILFKLTSSSVRSVSIAPPLTHFNLTNGPLFIPANTTRTFYSEYTLPFTLSTLSVGPHMHLIGKSIMSYGITPTNDTIPFINIPEWDFHWQGLYSFQNVLKLPAGTVLHSTAFYDNTSANPDNPNDPPQNVSWGENTTDEMMLVYFSYLLYQPGDENIVIDSSTITSADNYSFSGIISSAQLYEPSPNPVTSDLSFDFYMADKSSVSFVIYDVNGRLIASLPSTRKYLVGLNREKFSIANLASGNYILQMKTETISRSKKFIKD
jgi:hypothetical protein